MDRETFAKGMFILGAAYERELNQDTLEVYFSFLSHLTPHELERAARKHISQSSWFPKINEILRAAEENAPGPIDVWNRLIAAAEDGEKPEMDAATATALAVIGGWEEFSRTSYDSLHYRFKEFKAAYLEAREQERNRVEIPHQQVPQIEDQGE